MSSTSHHGKNDSTLQLLLATPRGLCAGVKRAIETAEAALKKFGRPVYCLNEIVHNRQVVEQLTAQGAIFVHRLEEVPDGSVLLFSAHGAPPSARAAAQRKKLRVIDATCPFVAKAHEAARAYADRGFTIFLIGKHGHEEVVGIAGEAPDHVRVIETAEEARTTDAPDASRTAVLTQTTLSWAETQVIREILRRRFPNIQTPAGKGICYATRNRQQAVQELARHAQAVFVLGSPNSSNSRRLVEVARAAGVPAELIPDLPTLEKHIHPSIVRLGLTAGASVPEHFINQAIALLQKHGYTTAQEIGSARENIVFSLPDEIRY
ncbi:MAG: 4-hydroxy-3-methylbut-2-enyl diphosphate reductase [Kiritimatiellia bacterium]|jgi:4-hydroxy-3-methylbut-2-enyl diphosphate reductase